MKKVILIIIGLFVYINVSALELPDIDLSISNLDGVEIEKEGTIEVIPYGSVVKLKEFGNNNDVIVIYNGEEITIDKLSLKPVEDVFTKGYELLEIETVKVLSKDGLNMYKGPSSELFDKLDIIIPSDAEITYKLVDNALNTTDKYVYTTYNGISGWVLISTSSETVAKKEVGTIMIINPNNIQLGDKIDGEVIDKKLSANTVVQYDYVTKYHYHIKEDAWLSISGNYDIALEATIGSVQVNSKDSIYAKPTASRAIYKFESDEIVNPTFYCNNYYYISHGEISGWIKSDTSQEKSTMIEPIKEEIIEVPKEVVEKPQKKAIKVELIVLIGLSVLLILSITSLIAVGLMSKKGDSDFSKKAENNTDNINNNK